MNTLTTTRTTQLPRVNLLPPEIAAERRFRAIQVGLGGMVLAVLGAVGVVYVFAAAGQGAAEDELAAAQVRQLTLQRDVREYDEVPPVLAEVAKAETQLASAMGPEVRWSEVLSDTYRRLPANVGLRRITIAQDISKPLPATVQGVKTGGPIIAIVSTSGVALSPGINGNHANLALWLEALAQQKRHANPYFTASALSEKNLVAFESTFDVNQQALSRRYTSQEGK